MCVLGRGGGEHGVGGVFSLGLNRDADVFVSVLGSCHLSVILPVMCLIAGLVKNC